MAGFNYSKMLTEFNKRYDASTNAGWDAQGSLYDSVIIGAGAPPNQHIDFFVVPMGTGPGGSGIGGLKNKNDTNMEQARKIPNSTAFLIQGIGMQLRIGTAKADEAYQPPFTQVANTDQISALHACGYEVRMYFQQTQNYQWSERLDLIPSVSGFSTTTTTDGAAAATAPTPGWGGFSLHHIYGFGKKPYPLMENSTFQVSLISDIAPAAMSNIDDTLDAQLQIILLGRWYRPFA